MTFTTFVLQLRDNIDHFEFWYQEKHNESPDEYPLEVDALSEKGYYVAFLQFLDETNAGQ